MAQELVFGIRLNFDGKEVTGGLAVTREQFRQFASDAKAAGEATAGGYTSAAKGVRSVSEQLGDLGKVMGTTARLSILGFGLSELAQAKQALLDAQVASDKLRSGLTFSFGGTQAAAEEMVYLRKVTNELGLEFGSASQAYMKLSASAQGTALAGTQARGIFEAVAKASMVMGLSAEEANGALLAISQMMSKGSVQSEELRGQLGERLPGAFQIAARAMKVTTAELGKMLDTGQVMASDFLPKFATELTKSLGDAPERAAHSTQAAMNRMAGAWLQAKQAFGETGVTAPLVAGLESSASAMRRFADAVSDAKKAGWNGLGQFLAGIGAVEAGAVGIATSTEEKKRELVARIAELRRGQDALDGRYLTAMEQESLRDLQRQENVARQQLALLAGRGKIEIDLRKDQNAQLAAVQQRTLDIHKKAEEELAKYDERFAKRKQLADLAKANAELKATNPALYDQLMGAARAKLLGPAQEAITDARLDAQMSGIKAWYEQYKDVIKRSLDESAIDYDSYWKLVEAGERRLAEAQLSILEQKKKAASRPGREPEQIRLQGEIDALRERLATGIPAEAARGLTADVSKAKTAGANAETDWKSADAKALASASAWRRRNLSLMEQELAVAREKIGLDLQERQGQLAKNEALKHAPELLEDYKRKAEEESQVTLAAIEAEIRARHAANASWEVGANRAMLSYQRDAQDVAKASEQAFSRAFSTMEDALVQFTMTGKVNFSSLANSFISELVRMEMRARMSEIMGRGASGGGSAGGLFGSIFGWLTGGQGSSIGPSTGSVGVNTPDVYTIPVAAPEVFAVPFAKGGVFGDGSLHQYANTVRDTPTYFAFNGLHKFAQGGVFGEAGPEAVMPLTRDSQGRLGVRSQGDQQQLTSLKVEIVNPGSLAKAVDSESVRFDGPAAIVRVVLKDVAEGGPISTAMARQFGLNRAAGTY